MSDKLEQSKVFNPAVIKKGIIIFIGITLVAFIGIFLYNDGMANIQLWSQLKLVYLLIGLLFIAVDLYVGGLRNHLFIREFKPGISQMVSIKANLANIFMGAVTPSQSGGGPAQWYIFVRNGVKLADIVGVSFYTWICTLVFFPISGALAIFILKDSIPNGFVLNLTQFGFSVFSTLLTVILLGLFAPKVISYIINGLANIIGLFKASSSIKLKEGGAKGVEKLTEYRVKYLGLIKRKPQLMLYCFLLTIVLYFSKYALAYVFIIAFGFTPDFLSIIAVMGVSYLLSYFAPSPGGSGIAELGITALLIPIIGSELAPSITLLHRSFLVFIPALLGAIVVLRQISQEAQ